MGDFNLYPDLIWLFAAVNLAAWYFKGAALFSWWWLVAVFLLEIIAKVALAAAVAGAVASAERKKRGNW